MIATTRYQTPEPAMTASNAASNATSSSKAWVKPALAALLIAAAGLAAYVTLNQRPSAPQVTFLSIKGEKISPESLRGKVVMVNFWATSCTTCVAEMPKMVDTYNKFKSQGLEFVAVAMKEDPPNYVINYAETRKLPFKVALDVSGDAAKAYGNVAMTPTTFVIDRNGKILKRYLGEPDFAALHKLLEKSLQG
jgi:peroxiredoxin